MYETGIFDDIVSSATFIALRGLFKKYIKIYKCSPQKKKPRI